MRRYIEIEDGQEILQEAVKEGKIMVEERDRDFQLQGEVKDLQRQLVELKHSMEDSVKDRFGAVRDEMKTLAPISALTKAVESQAQVAQTLKALQSDLFGKADRSEVSDLVSKCFLDPSGPGCRMTEKTVKMTANLLLDEARKKVAEEREGEAEGDHVIHKTANDYLGCPECGPTFQRAVRANTDFLKGVLCSPGDVDCQAARAKLGLLSDADLEARQKSKEEKATKEKAAKAGF